MAASKEENERYLRSVENPFKGWTPWEIAARVGRATGMDKVRLPAIDPRAIAGSVFSPSLNPYNVRDAQQSAVNAGLKNPDPRVVFDVPAAGRQALTRFDPAATARETGRSAMKLMPGVEAINAVVGGLTGMAPRLGIGGFPDAKAATPPKAAAPKPAAVGNPFTAVQPGMQVGGYDTVLGFGKYGQPPAPLSQMTMGQVYDFGRSTLIPNSKADGIGRDSRGLLGSSAVGRYQITGETMARYAPAIFGKDWRNMKFGPAEQDMMGQALYASAKGDPRKLMSIWAGLDPQTAQQAAAAGWDQGKNIIARAEGTDRGGGNGLDFQSPFQPQMWQNVLDTQQQAAQQAAQPWSMEFDRPEAPAFPDKPETPVRDYSETDRLLETLRPVMIDEQRQKKIRQSNLFGAAAAALASTPENAHWGKVLANVGAGLLAGRAAGDQEIQKYQDAFDEKMAAFNMMGFKYEDQKSAQLYDAALQDAQNSWQYSVGKYNHDMKQYEKDWSFQASADGVMATSKLDGGKVRVAWTPNPHRIASQMLEGQAGTLQAMAGASQSGQAMVTSMNNNLMLGAAMTQMRTAQQDPRGAMDSSYLIANEIVSSGMGSELIGADGWEEATKQAQQLALRQGFTPGSKEYTEFMNNTLSTNMMELMLNNEQFRGRVQTKMPTLYGRIYGRRTEESRRTIKADSRGRTTETVESPF